jgi:hypothetical protein
MTSDTEGLKPCPFCGGPARIFEYNGTTQAQCAKDYDQCAGTDVTAPVAMWNLRSPSTEGVEPDDAMVERAAEVIWNDFFGSRAGAWGNPPHDRVSAIQTRATARASLRAALQHTPADSKGKE